MIANTLTSAFRLSRLEWKREKENYKYNLSILKKICFMSNAFGTYDKDDAFFFFEIHFLSLLVNANTLKS